MLHNLKAEIDLIILFQSSPDPKAGCYGYRPHEIWLIEVFQSSPDPKAGCYIVNILRGRRLYVSILTRPEGRVLLNESALALEDAVFQSSPDPKAGCYSSVSFSSKGGSRFNPHPTRRPGAT